MRYQNNPGNIRYNSNFKGCTGNDNGFCKFSSLGYGYRAILVILNTYYDKYKLRTIRGIVNRYAPPSENQTEYYISSVSRYSGLDSDQNLTKEDLIKLIPAIARMENSISITVPEVKALIDQANSGGNIALSAIAAILALYFFLTLK